MFKRGIRGGICRSINSYSKTNNKYMNDYKSKNHHILSMGYK